MIVSNNPKPALTEFHSLMQKTDILLNDDASKREEYYTGRGGKLLENDVYEAISESAKGTAFEGTIELVSGASFPDIVANKFYGVEVKSTIKNHWTSIGSSILESTRNQEVERIFLTFGKLGRPVRFLSRPYEECLSEIAITHYPRYQIDMKLGKGETIFDKMGIPYDELRKMDNPVAPVSKYYKSRLRPGESLWWASSGEEQSAVPPVVKLWTTLTREQKDALVVQGYILFPELLHVSNATKYNRFALWLATQKGIVNTSVRDSFSAGGRVELPNSQGLLVRMPAAFGRISRYRDEIKSQLYQLDEEILKETWELNHIEPDRISHWCKIIAREASSGMDYDLVYSVLTEIFKL